MSRARDNADLGDSYGVLGAGVTGGSGLNAVSPANLASGVLPVGVTGGSGLTALGTVTAGNLSNTAIVYPAGHIIQVGSTSDFSAISFDTGMDTICTVQLTNVLASSICIVMGYVSCLNLLADSDTGEGFEMYVYRDAVNLSAGMGGSTDCAAFAYKVHETNIYMPISANIKDSSPTTGTNNYYLKGSSGGGSPATAYDGTYGLTVFEVAQ